MSEIFIVRPFLRALLLAFALAAAGASASAAQAEGLQRVAKLAPGVYLSSSSGEGPLRTETRAARGAASSKPSPYVVGGSETTIEQWPWQAAIAYNPDLLPGFNGFERQFCGGSLVAPTVVITAAHCLHDNPVFGTGFADPALFSTITGRTELSSNQGQESDLIDYYLFTDRAGRPLYDPATSEWDVAFIELATPSSSGTIKLAGAHERDLWGPDRPAVVTGWGATSEGGSGSDVLQQAQIEMLSDSSCGSFYEEYNSRLMTCAGLLEGGRDTCQGDSGGPLVVPAPGGGHRLVGDTSFGEGCARPGVPAVYGRLADDPIRSGLQEGILQVAGVDVVAKAPAADPPAAGACNQAKRSLKKAKARLQKARQRARSAADEQRAKRKVKAAKKKVGRAKRKVLAEC